MLNFEMFDMIFYLKRKFTKQEGKFSLIELFYNKEITDVSCVKKNKSKSIPIKCNIIKINVFFEPWFLKKLKKTKQKTKLKQIRITTPHTNKDKPENIVKKITSWL